MSNQLLNMAYCLSEPLKKDEKKCYYFVNNKYISKIEEVFCLFCEILSKEIIKSFEKLFPNFSKNEMILLLIFYLISLKRSKNIFLCKFSAIYTYYIKFKTFWDM